MALCFECGAVMHNDDARAHVCNPEDLPIKGTIKRTVTNATTTTS